MSHDKELTCTKCIHREVCSLKDKFLNAQTAVDDLTVYFPESDGKTSMAKLYNIPFILPVTLRCKHFSADYMPNVRKAVE